MEDQDYYPRPRHDVVERQTTSTSASLPSSLQPAPVDAFHRELLACLVLCAPSGMVDDQRIEWVKVARQTIGDLPADLLKEGCAESRKKADHPAKIVPIIMATVEGAMKARRSMHQVSRIPPERRIDPHYVDPAAAAKILEEHGLEVPEILKPKGGAA